MTSVLTLGGLEHHSQVEHSPGAHATQNLSQLSRMRKITDVSQHRSRRVQKQHGTLCVGSAIQSQLTLKPVTLTYDLTGHTAGFVNKPASLHQQSWQLSDRTYHFFPSSDFDQCVTSASTHYAYQ